MATFKQEMPPKGGFGPIQWARVIPKKRITGWMWFGGYVGVCAVGWAMLAWEKAGERKLKIENVDARLAMEPLFEAERERAFLRHLRANREEEAELMKDVPGWVVGTLWGEPVYHNQADRFPYFCMEEYFVHNSRWDFWDRVDERFKHT